MGSRQGPEAVILRCNSLRAAAVAIERRARMSRAHVSIGCWMLDVFRYPAELEAGARVLDLSWPPMEFRFSFSFSVQSWTITWIRQIEPLHGAFRNESDDSHHEGDAAIVSDQVSGSFA